METLSTLATTGAWIAGSYVIADFGTGVIHWIEDTWMAPGASNFLDRYVMDDNLDHHRRPGMIRKGTYWETNRSSICLGLGLAVLAAACRVDAWQVYVIIAIGSHGNQVHKWAHMSDRPVLVAWLQSIGLLQSRGHHGRHHSHPYAVRYCALTNYLNPMLDGIGFWRGLERIVEACGATVQRGTEARHGY